MCFSPAGRLVGMVGMVALLPDLRRRRRCAVPPLSALRRMSGRLCQVFYSILFVFTYFIPSSLCACRCFAGNVGYTFPLRDNTFTVKGELKLGKEGILSAHKLFRVHKYFTPHFIYHLEYEKGRLDQKRRRKAPFPSESVPTPYLPSPQPRARKPNAPLALPSGTNYATSTPVPPAAETSAPCSAPSTTAFPTRAICTSGSPPRGRTSAPSPAEPEEEDPW